jgi:deoxyribose-phosphate aldolase
MFGSVNQLAQIIDHTLVRPDAALNDLTEACENAKKYGFASVVVNSSYVAYARKLLTGSLIKVCAVVGFPHGANTTTVKIFEAMECVKNGASELDIVMNIGMVKSRRFDFVEIDIKNIIAMTPQKIHKVIIEAGSLTPDEITKVSQIVVRAGADFIKTSTGYGPRGATTEDVRLIKQAVGTLCRIKASGGIRDLEVATAMVEAGADRIGTSAGPAIMEQYLKQNK